jgi:hypothetical protein
MLCRAEKQFLPSSLPFQGPKKSRFSGATPSNGAVMGLPASKISTSRAIHINDRYINS